MQTLKTHNQNKLNLSSQNRIHPWDIFIVGILFCLCLFITINIGEKSYDDAYITFRYASNLASGQGFVYNPGENYLGTTTPFFSLLLASIKVIIPSSPIPSIGRWLTGAALFGLAFFTYLFGRNGRKLLAGIVPALIVILNPILILVWGGESILALALIAAAFYFYFQGREILPAVLIGLAFLTRGEGILPGIVLLVHYTIVHKKLPWKAAAACCLVILPWSIFSLSVFGSPLPGSLHAKIAQMKSGLFPPFFSTSLDMFRGYIIGSPHFPDITPNYLYLILVLFGFIGGVSLGIPPRQHRWWALAAWIALYALGYSLLNVPFYHWYSIPLLYGGIILAGLGFQFAWDFVQNGLTKKPKIYRQIILAGLVVVIGLPVYSGFKAVQNYVYLPVSQIQQYYAKTGKWLQENTPATASVGFFEIGVMGYYSNRTFVDPVGLVNRGVSEHVARQDFKWAYLHYKPDYLVINPIRFYDQIGNIRDESWFSSAYREITEIDGDGYFDSPMIVYQKINDAAIPIRN